MRKKLIDFVIRISSFFKKNKKYKAKEYVKLNLGCGLRCLPGWINIDGSLTALFGSEKFTFINKILYKLAGSSQYYSFDEFNEIIQKNKLKFFDLRKGVPFVDNNADVIYVSHFIEHLNKKDGRFFMEECYRVLKSGGLLRIAVPDLDVAFEMYKNGKVEEMQDLFFYTSNAYDFSAHKYNYNFQFLKEVLENIGFKDVERKDYQKGNCPDIEYLDVYPDHSLYIECKKVDSPSTGSGNI